MWSAKRDHIADNIQLYPEELYENGLKIISVPTRRINSSALPPAVKSLNYLNNILAKIEAKRVGYLEALMLNDKGEIAECTGDNVFIIREVPCLLLPWMPVPCVESPGRPSWKLPKV